MYQYHIELHNSTPSRLSTHNSNTALELDSPQFMNATFDGTGSAFDCLIAQTVPVILGNGQLNTDIGGPAVVISNIVLNIVLPILITFSSEKEAVSSWVALLLFQFYPTLVAVVVNAIFYKGSLALFDVHYALTVAASPITAYIVVVAYLRLCHILFRKNVEWNGTLFSHEKERNSFLWRDMSASTGLSLMLCLLLPWLLVGLRFTASFSTKAFSNSHLCRGMTVSLWFRFQFFSGFFSVIDQLGMRNLSEDISVRGGLGMTCFCVALLCQLCLVQHRNDIYREFATNSTSDARDRSSLVKIFVRGWNFVAACWIVIVESNPWILIFTALLAQWSWVLDLIKGLQTEPLIISYGQVITFFSIIPPASEVIKLAWDERESFRKLLRTIPKEVWRVLCFVMTGKQRYNSWKPKESTNASIVLPKPDIWTVMPLFILLNLGHLVWTYFYVLAIVRPVPRIPLVNDPHSAWRPFCASLYIYGFLLAFFNLFFGVTFIDPFHQPDLVTTTHNVTVLTPGTGNRDTVKRNDHFKLRKESYAFLQKIQKLVFFLARFILTWVCLSPFFIPIIAFPLARVWEWGTRCKPYHGEAYLHGRRFGEHGNPQINLQFTMGFFQYELLYENANLMLLMSTKEITSTLSHAVPHTVAYNRRTGHITGFCEGPTSTPSLCMKGTYNTSSYFSVYVEDLATGEDTRLQSIRPEWRFPNDAPSFALSRLKSLGESNHAVADDDDEVLKTQGTRNTECNVLKICFANDVPIPAILAALSIALEAQDKYGIYCTLTRRWTQLPHLFDFLHAQEF